MKTKKKFTSLIMVVLLVFTMTSTVFAKSNLDNSVLYNTSERFLDDTVMSETVNVGETISENGEKINWTATIDYKEDNLNTRAADQYGGSAVMKLCGYNQGNGSISVQINTNFSYVYGPRTGFSQITSYQIRVIKRASGLISLKSYKTYTSNRNRNIVTLADIAGGFGTGGIIAINAFVPSSGKVVIRNGFS